MLAYKEQPLQPFVLSAHPGTTTQDKDSVVKEQSYAPTSENEPLLVAADSFTLAQPLRYTNLILDLGDVLAFYSGRGLDLPIDAYTIRQIINCKLWFDQECGQLSRDECLDRASHQFEVTPVQIQETLDLLASTLKYNTELISLVHYLKMSTNGQLRVHLATNITAVDWEVLKPTVESWGIFDTTFTSFNLRTRKPQQSFYRHMLEQARIDPNTALFIDDKAESIVAARSLGIHGIHFTAQNKTATELKNIFGDPVDRGMTWLRAHAREMWSETNTGVVIKENFAQMIILENLRDRSLITLEDKTHGKWNYYNGPAVLTTKTFPDDLDTTALAFRNIEGLDRDMIGSVLDEMLQYVNEDGLFGCYFDHNRPRFDLNITANIFRSYYELGRGHQVCPTLQYLLDVARTRAYECSMQYYLHPDWFFYHMSAICTTDMVEKNPELAEFRDLLLERLPERFGSTKFSDAWSATMRVIAAQNLGIDNPKDLQIIKEAQQADGSWSKEPWIYRFGHGVLIGNVGMVTAAAVRALKTASEQG